MTSREIADITGISVRTLHHYDEIGLLRPKRNPFNHYREYSESDIEILQQILFFKACGFSLQKIKSLLSMPDFDQEKAFELQKKILLYEKEKISKMIQTLEKTIQAKKGEIQMSQKEKFIGFDFNKNPYKAEVKERWGEEAAETINNLSKQEKNSLGKGLEALFMELAQIQTEPDAQETQQAIGKMYDFFNENMGYYYTSKAFAGVGQLYITDERFTRNINQYRVGLAEFLAESMGIFAKNKEI